MGHLTDHDVARYLNESHGDEIDAALALAYDRADAAGDTEAPDFIEIHHALYLVRFAQGKPAPSPDILRRELRSRKLLG